MSFATHWIRAEIFDYILRHWRIVKVATAKSQRKLFFKLSKLRELLRWMTRAEVDTLAENLDVAPETAQEMETRMSPRGRAVLRRQRCRQLSHRPSQPTSTASPPSASARSNRRHSISKDALEA